MTDTSLFLLGTDLTNHVEAVESVHAFDEDGNVVPQVHGTSKHTGDIGDEDQITFATTGGHAHNGTNSKKVAWGSISGAPTTISSFENDSEYKTAYCTYCSGSYCSYCTYC